MSADRIPSKILMAAAGICVVVHPQYAIAQDIASGLAVLESSRDQACSSGDADTCRSATDTLATFRRMLGNDAGVSQAAPRSAAEYDPPQERAIATVFPPLPPGAGTPLQRQFWQSRCQGRVRNSDPAALGCAESWKMLTGMSAPRAATQMPAPAERPSLPSVPGSGYRSAPIPVIPSGSFGAGGGDTAGISGLAASHCLKPSNRGRTYLFNGCSFPVTISYCVLAPNNVFTCGPVRQGLVSGGGSASAQAGATVPLAHGAGDTNPNGTSDYRLRFFACRQTGGVSAFLTQADPPKGVCK